MRRAGVEAGRNHAGLVEDGVERAGIQKPAVLKRLDPKRLSTRTRAAVGQDSYPARFSMTAHQPDARARACLARRALRAIFGAVDYS